jgi:drug/metabolite transporter (DMT)-like permease
VIAVAAVAVVIVATATPPRVSRAEVPRIAVIGLLDILGLILFALATDSGLLSVVAVLASLFPAVTVLLARTLLDERLARVQQLGILAALGGVAALAVA